MTTCTHCGRVIEDDDGTWFHPDTMTARCDGPDDEEGLSWGDMVRTAEPPTESTGMATLYPCGHTSHDERVPAVVVYQFNGHGGIHGSCHEHDNGMQDHRVIHDDRPFREPVPATYEVRPIIGSLDLSKQPRGTTLCGHCGLRWDDDIATGITPAPAARCPFEPFHRYMEEDA